jgi:Transcriptional regulator
MRNSGEIIAIVKIAMEKNGITPAELSRRLDMPKSTLSRYLNGSRQFPVDRAEDFANALNVSTEYLIDVKSLSEYHNITQDEKLIELMRKAEKNHGLKLVFHKTADLDDKELEKLSKMIDIIKEED